jgi:AcrR family transcriptional regulator
MSTSDQAETPSTEARDRLLALVMEHVRANGIGEPSLRQLAADVGTSHPLLKYHFGSRDGVLVAVAEVVAERERRLVEGMVAENKSLTVAEQLRVFWRNATSASFLEYARLFFELYGQALQSRAHTIGFLDGEVEGWLDPLTELFRRAGASPGQARVDARVTLATMRGLLLDLLATGDRSAVEAALERFLDRFTTPEKEQHDA